MRYSKSTRYALCATLQMALCDEAVSVGQVAERYGIPKGALARVLQDLVRAGLAVGTRGVGGGYRLARPPAEITVLDVISIFEPLRPQGSFLLDAPPEGTHLGRADGRLRALIDEVDEVARTTFASVSLETLARGA